MTELLLFRVGAAQFAIDLPLISNIQSAKSSIVLQNEGGAGLLQTESGEEIPLFDLAYFFLGNGRLNVYYFLALQGGACLFSRLTKSPIVVRLYTSEITL